MYPIFSSTGFIVMLSAFCLQCISENTYAQDLASIDSKNPVKVTGGVNATQTFYNACGIQNRRDPYYWLFSANLNFEILGVYIPFSATISQQNKSYTQPFNQYGLSPRYKSVTAHIGYRSMSFSNYTLGGNIFLGAGLELAPSASIIKFSAMYGRFTKAVAVEETEGVISGTPAYERWGYGGKVSIGKINHNVDLILFHGKDNVNSLPIAIADSFRLTPAENIVLGINTKHSITNKLTFDAEYALSAYTLDARIGHSGVETYRYVNSFRPIFQTNVSTQFNKAILTSITLIEKLFEFRISYRRIDPEFKTMGSVFLNNDLEDITGNLGWRMFKNKMNISFGAGVQKNNLDNALASRMNRLIWNINWSFVVSKKLNLNAVYSNFTANTKINNTRISSNQLNLNQNVDSLAYNQVTNSANAAFNYNAGTDKTKQIVFGTGSYQRANDNHGNNSVFYNATGGYQYGFTPIGLNITLSCNYNRAAIKETITKSIGPTLGVSKLLFKKGVRSTLSVTHLQTFTNDVKSGDNSMLRFSNSYKKGKHHVVTMDLTFMNRNISSGPGQSFSEFRGNLIYGFTF